MQGFSIIVAYEKTTRGIGFQNSIPWRITEDMTFFRKTTTHTQDPTKINAIIMGKYTWQSLPKKYLPKRVNICLTHQPHENTSEIQFMRSLEDALHHVRTSPQIESVFVIGGAKVYQEAIQHPQCQEILIHELLFEPKHIPFTDAFFPEIPEQMYQEVDIGILPKIHIDKSIQIQPRRFLRKHVHGD
jgi:dihydrofolate reductase